MCNSKNIIIVLVVILIALIGWTYYTLTVSVPEKAEAECEAIVESQVMSAVQECQQTLQQLMQIPACASALTQ